MHSSTKLRGRTAPWFILAAISGGCGTGADPHSAAMSGIDTTAAGRAAPVAPENAITPTTPQSAASAPPTTAAPPTFSQVYETIYTASCAVCHSMAPSDSSNGRLGMIRSRNQLYEALLEKPAQGSKCADKGMYVVPGKPALSLLLQKLSATPPCGAEMPLGSMLDRQLVRQIEAWIAAGAPNN